MYLCHQNNTENLCNMKRENENPTAFFKAGVTHAAGYTIITTADVRREQNGRRGLHLAAGISYRIYNAAGELVSFGMANDTSAATLRRYRALVDRDIRDFNLGL